MAEKQVSIIAFFIPALGVGGTERVVAILSNQFVSVSGIAVHLILCDCGPQFYSLNSNVRVHMPDFDYRKIPRLVFTPRLLLFLRKKALLIKPDVLVSFGGRYNSFAILALTGTGIPVIISERSAPGISYGLFLNLLNPVVYRFSAGILAQTKFAAEYIRKKTGHLNIRVIGNPIPQFSSIDFSLKERIVLSVGRFVKTKNQCQMIKMFSMLPDSDWNLWFIGDGPELEACKTLAAASSCSHRIHFAGKQSELDIWYRKASIFAFPSLSEGFPNALAEAMAAGCVPVSYNCVAGPSELIQNGENGFLVPTGDEVLFMRKLWLLMSGRVEWLPMAEASRNSILKFSEDEIMYHTLNFFKHSQSINNFFKFRLFPNSIPNF